MVAINFTLLANVNPLGAPWVKPTPFAGGLRILSAVCRNSSGSDQDSGMFYSASSVRRSQVVLAATPVVTDGGPALMDSSGNGYIYTNYEGTREFIFRLDAGGFTELQAHVCTQRGANDVVNLFIQGNDVVCEVNGVEVLRVADTTYRATLSPGIFAYANDITFSSFTDGAVADGGATVRWEGPGVSPDKLQMFRPMRLSIDNAAAPISVTFTADGYAVASATGAMDRGADMIAAIPRPGPGINPDYTQLFRPRQFAINPPAVAVVFTADARALALGTASLQTAVQFAADARALAAATGALQVTSQLLADARALASTTALLQTAVQLSADARALASTTAAMGVQISFLADARGLASTTAALQTAARFLADARGVASAACTLQTVVQFSAAGLGIASATAALTAAGQFTADARGQASATGQLQTRLQFAADARALATATVTLGSGVQLSANGSSIASAAATLLTGVQFLASAQGLASATAALTVRDGLRADGRGRSTATGALTTAVQLAAAAQALASASASLNAAGAFVAIASAIASAAADLGFAPDPVPFGPGIYVDEDGDFATFNAFVSMMPGQTLGLIAAQPDGIALARFGWADMARGTASNRRTGSGQRVGFVGQVYGPARAIYRKNGLRWLRPGVPVTLYLQGDFWCRFPDGANAGDVVYASVLDGSPVSGYALNAFETPWRVIQSAPPGELALISSWSAV